MTPKTPKHWSGWKMEESYLAELFFKQYKEKNVNIAKTAERKEVTDHRHNGLFQASGYA